MAGGQENLNEKRFRSFFFSKRKRKHIHDLKGLPVIEISLTFRKVH